MSYGLTVRYVIVFLPFHLRWLFATVFDVVLTNSGSGDPRLVLSLDLHF
ncbi:MAG: hypothetical protein JOZ46_11695 [Candidatus Dormibacteraeota bacterium]|nr:hypothetical protein [Candidatus Dormibacteraeota bacterium]